MARDDTAISIIEEQADASIRREWVNERWYFSVVDVVSVLTDSAAPLQYWRDTKHRMQRQEGWEQTQEHLLPLRLRAADGKLRLTDCADTETLLRIIQSVPSPKAEPVKQWLARVGAKRLDAATRPIDAAQAGAEITVVTKPPADAPALAWAEYHEQLATLYRRQAAYEAQLAYVDAKLEEHDEEIAGLHGRLEGVEEIARLVPEILERLGPQTLTSEHQATVKALATRLHDLNGSAYSTIYSDLNAAFHVGRYSDIPDAQWAEVARWFQTRIDIGEKRQHP